MNVTRSLPRVAYVALWFPKASETFIFREVVNLRRLGLPLKVITLYGELNAELSPEMAQISDDVQRLGIPGAKQFPADIRYWLKRKRSECSWLFRTVPFRRWSSLEVGGENIWAFFCGFTLARLLQEQEIDHIHAAWANGPATAAWVASTLTGIPFSFTGRAGDIFPPDGALEEKIQDCAFVRTNPAENVRHLKKFANGSADKIVVVYDGYPLADFADAAVKMEPPYQLLAVGRLVRTKGFHVLLKAARIIRDWGVNFHLTIAGSGPREWQLKLLTRRLGLESCVSFPGFVTHDAISGLFRSADVFIMPSVVHSTGDRDGLPNVIAEALLHRLPVIATDVAGIKEVIHDRETGLLVEQKDPGVLARAVMRMIQDREASLKMAERGRALVLQMLDPERCHRQVLELFRKAHTDPSRLRDQAGSRVVLSAGTRELAGRTA